MEWSHRSVAVPGAVHVTLVCLATSCARNAETEALAPEMVTDVDEVAEVLVVAALVRRDRHALSVLLHDGGDDLVDRSVVAEVDHLDLHRRAAIGVAVVAPDRAHVVEQLDTVERRVAYHPEVELLSARRTIRTGQDE